MVSVQHSGLVSGEKASKKMMSTGGRFRALMGCVVLCNENESVIWWESSHEH